MYQFTTDDKTYTFPTTFKEIKLGDWQNILTILNSDFNDNKKYLKCISILLGVTEKVLLAMDDDIYIDLWERLNLLCAMKPSGKELNEYQMKDDKLYRITDFNKMTTAEYIDLDTMLKDSDIMWENMHIVMSILWRKKEGKRLAPYDPDIALEMAPKMKLMDVDTVYNSLIFFSVEKAESFSNFLDYSRLVTMKEMEREIAKMEKRLKKGGAGKSSWIRCLTDRCLKQKDGINKK